MADNIVVGYKFNDETSSKKALQELNTILKIQEKEASLTSEQKLTLFNKMINENYFTTPVGIEYLRKIQKDLYEDQTIESNQIKSIPVQMDGKNSNLNRKIENENIKESNNHQDKQSESLTHNDPIQKSNLQKNSKTSETKLNKINSKYKERFIKSLILNIVFVVVITVMFIITDHAKKYDLNYYRESVENEYINWENNLKERESIINEKENQP